MDFYIVSYTIFAAMFTVLVINRATTWQAIKVVIMVTFQILVGIAILSAFVWCLMGTSPCDDFYVHGLRAVAQCYAIEARY
jgi:hypothetical protein